MRAELDGGLRPHRKDTAALWRLCRFKMQGRRRSKEVSGRHHYRDHWPAPGKEEWGPWKHMVIVEDGDASAMGAPYGPVASFEKLEMSNA